MMGTKKWSEIEKELRQAVGLQRQKIQAWLDMEQAALPQHRKVKGKVAEELKWIRAYLQSALPAGKSPARKPARAQRKKTRTRANA